MGDRQEETSAVDIRIERWNVWWGGPNTIFHSKNVLGVKRRPRLLRLLGRHGINGQTHETVFSLPPPPPPCQRIAYSLCYVSSESVMTIQQYHRNNSIPGAFLIHSPLAGSGDTRK